MRSENKNRRILLLDSPYAQQHFVSEFDYRKLILFTQHQIIMAGLPYQLVSEAESAVERGVSKPFGALRIVLVGGEAMPAER